MNKSKAPPEASANTLQSDYLSMEALSQTGENVEPPQVDGREIVDDIELSADLSSKEQPRSVAVWLSGLKTVKKGTAKSRRETNAIGCVNNTRSSTGKEHSSSKHQNPSLLRLEYAENGAKSRPGISPTISKDYIGRPPPENTSCFNAEIRDLFRELVNYTKTKNWKKKVLTVLVFSSSVLVLVDLIFLGNIVNWLGYFILWMRTHIIEGIFAFIGIFVFTTLVFIPPSILMFGCGYILADVCGPLPGIIAATMACFIGSVIGAMICFLRARYMMRDLVELFARRYTTVRAIDKAIRRNGFRVMTLLRLCPLIPFHALNYIGGITSVSWEAFLFSLIGILPFTVLTVTVGATTWGGLVLMASQEGSEEQQLCRILLMCSGLAFCIIAVAITYYFAKKELQHELEAAAAASGSSGSLNVQPSDAVEGLEIAMEEVNDEEWFWIFT